MQIVNQLLPLGRDKPTTPHEKMSRQIRDAAGLSTSSNPRDRCANYSVFCVLSHAAHARLMESSNPSPRISVGMSGELSLAETSLGSSFFRAIAGSTTFAKSPSGRSLISNRHTHPGSIIRNPVFSIAGIMKPVTRSPK